MAALGQTRAWAVLGAGVGCAAAGVVLAALLDRGFQSGAERQAWMALLPVAFAFACAAGIFSWVTLGILRGRSAALLEAAVGGLGAAAIAGGVGWIVAQVAANRCPAAPCSVPEVAAGGVAAPLVAALFMAAALGAGWAARRSGSAVSLSNSDDPKAA